MTHMFNGVKIFNCDLNGWDVSKCNDFVQFFYQTQETEANVASWYDQTPMFAQTCSKGCPR